MITLQLGTFSKGSLQGTEQQPSENLQGTFLKDHLAVILRSNDQRTLLECWNKLGSKSIAFNPAGESIFNLFLTNVFLSMGF